MLQMVDHWRRHGTFTKMFNKCQACPHDHWYAVCICGMAFPMVADPTLMIDELKILSTKMKAIADKHRKNFKAWYWIDPTTWIIRALIRLWKL